MIQHDCNADVAVEMLDVNLKELLGLSEHSMDDPELHDNFKKLTHHERVKIVTHGVDAVKQ